MVSSIDNPETWEEGFIVPLAISMHNDVSVYDQISGGSPLDFWGDLPHSVQDAWKVIVWQLKREPDSSPQTLHEIWMDYKVNQGWTFGDEKDFDNRTHPGLRPWDDLSDKFKYRYTICKGVFELLTRQVQIPSAAIIDGDVIDDV